MAGVLSQPKLKELRNSPSALKCSMCPCAKLYRVYAPKKMLPSGAMVGEAEESSSTRPGGGSLVAGSTPKCAPARHPPLALAPPGFPMGKLTPQPSCRRLRMEAAHFPVRLGFTAIR